MPKMDVLDSEYSESSLKLFPALFTKLYIDARINAVQIKLFLLHIGDMTE